ncbi:nucleotidyltransferase family protein [Bifidobacterium sp. 82T24]|uniref:nucleotidyltransferase family protein n=1 Tax=Bifidobacterium pluvialisilvae TaxID=2834436 RepID=UPI001C5952F9|nr:nucleotidyltransferase family protein [Bifidobacterium pluvialisilvae]MBW3087922.1 nucleotidyltransferase family protein [Bifidobacterium pluvialisilvae]
MTLLLQRFPGSELEIERLVAADDWMMRVLAAARSLNLPDWWIGAGFLRNRVWDSLEGNEPIRPRDVDLVYFRTSDAAAETDWDLSDRANERFPFARWEIRNQARMHVKDGAAPFRSAAEGIAHWTETATAVAVTLREDGRLSFLYCHGSADLLGLVVRPVTVNGSTVPRELVERRIREKRWLERWPDLTVRL